MSNPLVPAKDVVSPPTKDRHYIDLTTNGINTSLNPAVTGTPDTFRVVIEPLLLDPTKEYTVEVVSWFYPNIVIGAPGAPPVYPLLLSDIGENIRVGGANSSLLFKSTVPCNTNLTPEARDNTNNFTFAVPIRQRLIRDINFQVVRSDNGQPLAFPPTYPHAITLLIQSI